MWLVLLLASQCKWMEAERVTAEYAAFRVLADLAASFRKMKDSAFTTKANDLEDLTSRVLKHLIGEHRVVVTIGDGEPWPPDSMTVNWPVHDVGPWPPGFTVRREDLYGDDGR